MVQPRLNSYFKSVGYNLVRMDILLSALLWDKCLQSLVG